VAGVATAQAKKKTPASSGLEAPARRRARRGEGERLRDEILEATAELLDEVGSADKVSTRAVAQRVGCSSPSIYLHFPDKVSLLYAVSEMQFEALHAKLEAAMGVYEDPVDRLRAAAHAYVEFAMEHPEQYRIMMMDEAYGAMYQEDLDNLAQSVGFNLIVRTVQDGIDQGRLKAADPTIVALSMWAAVHGLVSLVIVKKGINLPPIDDLVDLVCTQNMDGMRAQAPR
jgi:AcrR family transcriptional regulator